MRKTPSSHKICKHRYGITCFAAMKLCCKRIFIFAWNLKQRFLLQFVVQILYLLRYREDMGLQTLPCASLNITSRLCRLRTRISALKVFFKSRFEKLYFLTDNSIFIVYINLLISCVTSYMWLDTFQISAEALGTRLDIFFLRLTANTLFQPGNMNLPSSVCFAICMALDLINRSPIDPETTIGRIRAIILCITS